MFWNDSNFWCVRGSITRNVIVLVLWTVCTQTIPIRMLMCPWLFMLTCMFTYMQMYMYMCVHVFLCVSCLCMYVDTLVSTWKMLKQAWEGLRLLISLFSFLLSLCVPLSLSLSPCGVVSVMWSGVLWFGVCGCGCGGEERRGEGERLIKPSRSWFRQSFPQAARWPNVLFAVSVDRTPTHNTLLCSTVCSQARNASQVLGSRFKNCNIFMRLKRVCHLVCTCYPCLSLIHPPFPKSTLSSSSTLLSTTRPAHALHSGQHGHLQEHQYIINFQSTSSAIKNHSGVRTCRVAETRAQQLPQVFEPTELAALSRTEAHSGDPCQMFKKNLEKKITEEVKEFGDIGTSGLPCFEISETVQLPIADAFRRFCGMHCRFWSRRWRVTKDADLTTVCPESFGETRCNGRAGDRGKCTIYSSRTKGRIEVSFMWRSESFGETQCIVFIWAGKHDQESCVQKR